MKIINVRVQKNEPYRPDIVVIEGEFAEYALLADDIENLLIEDDQMCPECGDSGEIETGYNDDVTITKCDCKKTDD